MINIAINGYGRIGRVAHRIILKSFLDKINVVAINTGSSTDLKGWMYLLKYDTSYGNLANKISIKEKDPSDTNPDFLGALLIDDKEIKVYSQKDATLLPWGALNIDVVLECTGHFLAEVKAEDHIKAGAKRVIMSAPAKDETPTYVIGVNSDKYNNEEIVSNASCTTNCISPVAKIMVDNFGVEKAMMTTIHAFTSDQKLQDDGHKDYRRARAAADNIVPTTTGATIAATKAVPELEGLFTGLSIRVPVITGSLSDFTFLLKRNTSIEEVNKVLTDAANSEAFKNLVEVTTEPIVSSDIKGNSHSSIVDLSLTQVVGGNLVKIIAWYDNEWGYATRLVEEAVLVAPK